MASEASSRSRDDATGGSEPANLRPAVVASPETAISPPSLTSSTDAAPTQRTKRHPSNGFFSPVASPSRLSPLPSPSELGTSRPSAAAAAATSSHSFVKAYIDQSRELLEKQRLVFEQERALFEQERKLWDTERQALYARINELEGVSSEGMSRSVSGARKSKLGGPRLGYPSVVKPSVSGSGSGSSRNASRSSSTEESGDKFWEGSSSRQGSTVSRTFSTSTSKPDDGKLPSISESDSPNAREVNSNVVGNGIDISVIRNDLDGIPLKPSALPPDIVAQVHSPSPLRSPPDTIRTTEIVIGELDADSITDEALTKDAGHTPNAPRRLSVANNESGSATPTQPLQPHLVSATSSHAKPETETGATADEDPALNEPLALPADGTTASRFLHELDSKLLQEARKVVYGGSSETGSVLSNETDEHGHADRLDPTASPPIRQPEPEVRLKLKRSMNFGSAFGVAAVGPDLREG